MHELDWHELDWHELDWHELDWHELDWDDNDTPVSMLFADPFFSRQDGREETRHVFLAGNHLPGRWHAMDHVTIAELGFGTGLNFLEAVRTWQRHIASTSDISTATLTYVAFERYPLSRDDLERALSRWHDLGNLAAELTPHWPPKPGWSQLQFGSALLRICIGDANHELPRWDGTADSWFLDGFSPAKNPDLWGEKLMADVFTHTSPGGTFATYTAAGWVRRNLVDAGFTVAKMPGYGKKRECLHGHRPQPANCTIGQPGENFSP